MSGPDSGSEFSKALPIADRLKILEEKGTFSSFLQEAHQLSLALQESLNSQGDQESVDLGNLMSAVAALTGGRFNPSYLVDKLNRFLDNRGLRMTLVVPQTDVTNNWGSLGLLSENRLTEKDLGLLEPKNDEERQFLAGQVWSLLRYLYDKTKLSVGEESPELHALDLAQKLAIVVSDEIRAKYELNFQEINADGLVGLLEEPLRKFGIEISLKEQNQKETFSVS